MSNWKTPAVPDHLPWFFTAPGQTDGLFIAMAVLVVVVLIIIGVLYFKLLGWPGRIARSKVQSQIVAVLAVLALFQPGHYIWIMALLLALVEFPDFSTPIGAMADSLQRLARRMTPQSDESAEPTADASPVPGTQENAALIAPTASRGHRLVRRT